MPSPNPRQLFWVKLLISLAALVLLIVHLAFPKLKVDAITLGLFVLLVLPWLSALVKSAEFPGGWKVEFQELKDASDKVTEGATGTTRRPGASNTLMPEKAPEGYLAVATQDPNLALVALRIEIEKRVRKIADQEGVGGNQDKVVLSQVILLLHRMGIFDNSTVEGLQEIISAGNRAAHGAQVDAKAVDWALTYGQRVLALLDARIQPDPPKS